MPEPKTAIQAYDLLIDYHNDPAILTVVIPGTITWGDVGEDTGPGILQGITTFLRTRREWSVIEISKVGNGYITITRDPNKKQQLPSLGIQAWNLTKFKLGSIIHGKRLVSLEVLQERLSYCWLCPYRTNSQCTRCGCYLDRVPDDAIVDAGKPGKAAYERESCPMGAWGPSPSPVREEGSGRRV